MTTIRRQYSLPNCTLIVEGLSDSMGGSAEIGRPLLATAFNAECVFASSGQRLSGGREFLDSLTRSVSAYAQEFLSGIRHPLAHHANTDAISFTKGEDPHIHRLIWHPAAEQNGSNISPEPIAIDLTTVQLFDLVEAIDQLLADNRTLPDLKLALEPVSRRYRQADVPIAQRTAPAILGITSLAVAGALFFIIPVPKQIQEPKPAREEQVEGQSSPAEPTAGASPTSTESPTPQASSLSPEEIQQLLSNAPQITDATTLRYIERNLRKNLDRDWQNRNQIEENLEYRVAVTRGGSIVDFQPVENTPESAADRTPLPQLRYTPTRLGEREEIADFRVVFTNRSVLQVSPWIGYQGEPTLGTQIEDSEVLGRLKDELYQKLRDSWSGTPSYPRELVFRVGITEDGAIADYEANNQPAYDYASETPLPQLVRPEAAGIEEGKNLVPEKPLAQFKVVFKPSGVLEVSRW